MSMICAETLYEFGEEAIAAVAESRNNDSLEKVVEATHCSVASVSKVVDWPWLIRWHWPTLELIAFTTTTCMEKSSP